MRRRVLALAEQSLRTAIRSRVVVALLALLGVVAIVLPRSLHGDGTPASEIRLLLTWTLGATVALLAAASLWAGCSAVASEAEEGLLGGVVVTPLRPFELWLGKWLGLVVLNAALLAAVLVVVAAQLHFRGVTSRDLRPERRLLPSERSLVEHAQIIVSDAQTQGQVPPEADPADLVQEVLENLRTDHVAVNPGDAHCWWFDWSPQWARRGGDVRVVLEVLSSFGGVAGIEGLCRVRDAEGREVASTTIAAEDGRHVVFTVPADALGDSPAVAVEIENTGRGEGAAVLVGAADGATLLVPSGSFFSNLAMTGIVLWSALAALTAVGVAAGSLFSLPVAVFVATAVAAIGFLSHAELAEDAGCGHDHGQPGDSCQHLQSAYAVAVLQGVARLTKPLVDADVLDHLGDGIRVTLLDVLAAMASAGLALPAVFALIGTAALRWREYP